jgi:hypothetical protein
MKSHLHARNQIVAVVLLKKAILLNILKAIPKNQIINASFALSHFSS